jgi:hypothetical protein
MGLKPHASNHKLNMKKIYKRPLTVEFDAMLQRQFALETSDSESDPNKPYDAKLREEEQEEEEAIIQLLRDIDEGRTSSLW